MLDHELVARNFRPGDVLPIVSGIVKVMQGLGFRA